MPSFINTYFDRVFCINLDRRPDKWRQAQEELGREGISAERFQAVDGLHMRNGRITGREMGCTMSHCAILEMQAAESWERVLILEDDVVLVPGADAYFREHIPLVPEDWDLLYLGGNHVTPPVRLNDSVVRMTRTYCTHAYGVSLEMARLLLPGMRLLAQVVDVFAADSMPFSDCYAFLPGLAWQRPGLSDIQGRDVDYTDRIT